RNIVLIGRSRTGKSTIASVIENILYKPPQRELYSETKDVTFHKVATDAKSTQRYYFNIIDTPGFFEIPRGDSGNKFTNDRISSFIKSCITNDVTNVHLFAFVFNLAAGIIEKDIETMELIIKDYYYLSNHMALIITFCEDQKSETRKKLANDFFDHSKVKQSRLKEFFKQGFFFMGCLSYEAWENENEKLLLDQFINVLEMRTIFIEKCISSEIPYNVHHDSPCSIL
ncbi:unnamed protein product, partial [Rotaria sp. Silwood2]